MGTELESVFLNGTVGSGKSTTGEALHQLLAGDEIGNAVIDLDELRRSWPVPANDRFNHEMELRNLSAVAANYRGAGVRRFILAGVLEDPAEVSRYVAALGAGKLTVVRLNPPIDVVQAWLRNRHEVGSAELRWHLHRSVELNQILDKASLDHHVLAPGTGSPRDMALSVRALLDW
jgi:hypothetical protein